MYVQVPQMVTNLVFSYSGKDFAPPVPALRSIHSRGVGREVASEDWGKKKLFWKNKKFVVFFKKQKREPQCSLHPLLPVFQSCSSGRYAFFDLSFLADIAIETLLTSLCIPCHQAFINTGKIPLSCLLSRLNCPSSVSFSIYGRCSSSLIAFVAVCFLVFYLRFLTPKWLLPTIIHRTPVLTLQSHCLVSSY